MRLLKKNINGVSFFYREGFSDLKTFEEVIGRKIYENSFFKIEKGEKWIDLGANVGAFSLFVKSKGADVALAVEPDKHNAIIFKKNTDAKISESAVVYDKKQEKMKLYIGNNGDVWRNSLVKKWNKKFLEVDLIKFSDILFDGCCIKMDIEGAEMEILEKITEDDAKKIKKLVFEWSFDIDRSLERFWSAIERLGRIGFDISTVGNKGRFITRDFNAWQKNWFPACENVFLVKK